MEAANWFDLNSAVNRWLEQNCHSDEFLPEDVLQIKSDLLTSVDEIVKEYNISEKDALDIACERMGDHFDWNSEMKQVNEDNFQLKKVVLLFGGVIFYIFSYHFILCLNRSILILGIYLNGNVGDAIANSATYFNVIYFISVVTIVAVYFWHKPVKWLFSKVATSTTVNVIFVIATFAAVILELYLMPKVRVFVDSRAYESLFFSREITFKYVYFGLILLGYILLFTKYSKKFSE